LGGVSRGSGPPISMLLKRIKARIVGQGTSEEFSDANLVCLSYLASMGIGMLLMILSVSCVISAYG